MLLALLMSLSPVQTGPAAPDCSAAEHRQLDFWLGRWAVVETATGEPAGESVIEPIYRGCAIRETFESPAGFVGGSTSLWIGRPGNGPSSARPRRARACCSPAAGTASACHY